jgi:hypothetical protein
LIVSRENISVQDYTLLRIIAEVGDDLVADDLPGSLCQHGEECRNMFLVIDTKRTKAVITERVSVLPEYS